MFIRLLFALLILVPALPAAADAPPPAPAVEAAAPAACRPDDRLAQLTQTECCKGHKGICGCRAGKIVCCDGTTSKEPGCTCHGEDGFAE
jgi:hypothetical protein